MAKSVDPDEAATYKLSQLDLHCLQRNLCWYPGIKELKEISTEQADNSIDLVESHFQEKQLLIWLAWNSPVNTIKIMSSRSLYLAKLFLGRLSPQSSQPVVVPILSPETDNRPS